MSTTQKKQTRRDFMVLTSGALGALGAVALAKPFISSMNPAADVLALATIDVDLSTVSEGQAITVLWRGKPVFIRHRTQQEIQDARVVTSATLPDPESDEIRTPHKPEWLVVVGVCTHLGCVPLGQKASDTKGEYNGWFCPCHGSHYDTSGRIRKGPAPKNLEVPTYQFVSDTTIRIGSEEA
ncbi:MAG: ubiquinol-cytochrome c reductase iron-sulfur subunit [Alphaproteobacteria bacterium]